ncbi:MAG: AraC family transcriptional regulator [Cyanobacteria bacterium J06632_22]
MLQTNATHRTDLLEGYWFTTGDGEHPYTVIPDGCIDWVCELSVTGCQWFVYGTTTVAMPQPLQPDAAYFGIRFKPGKAHGLINTPVAALTDTFQPIDSPWECGHRYPWPSLIKKANDFVETLPFQNNTVTETVDGAVALLKQHGGQLSIAHLAQALAISERQLSRLFTQTVGVSPKRFGRITRFQQVCQQLQQPHANMADLAIATGYTDQAHLCKDFKQLMGCTPTAYSGITELRTFAFKPTRR